MWLIKTVEGQDVESIATAIDTTAIHRVCQTREIRRWYTCCYLIHAKDYQNINMQQVTFFNDSWEDYQDIYKGK